MPSRPSSAADINATTLHYDQNVGTCIDGELVVVDVGARYGYYCGDLTRTFPVNGRFTDRQRGIYDLVLEAHDRVAEAIKPGIRIFDLRKIAYEVMESSELRDANGEKLGQYFIHGLGHFLGLDAHDPGSEEAAPRPRQRHHQRTRDLHPRRGAGGEDRERFPGHRNGRGESVGGATDKGRGD